MTILVFGSAQHSVRGQVKVTMFDYIEEMLAAFEKADPKSSGTKSSAAPVNLFTVNEDCEKLKQNKAYQYQIFFHYRPNLVPQTDQPTDQPTE